MTSQYFRRCDHTEREILTAEHRLFDPGEVNLRSVRSLLTAVGTFFQPKCSHLQLSTAVNAGVTLTFPGMPRDITDKHDGPSDRQPTKNCQHRG